MTTKFFSLSARCVRGILDQYTTFAFVNSGKSQFSELGVFVKTEIVQLEKNKGNQSIKEEIVIKRHRN